MIHFLIFATGRNCGDNATEFNHGFANQSGQFTKELWVYDDASDCRDSMMGFFRYASMVFRGGNRGYAAKSRWTMIEAALKLRDHNTVMVMCDLDDWIIPGALSRVAQEYVHGADMTYGNFEFQDGSLFPSAEPYPPHVLANKRFETYYWRCHPLRTFRLGIAASLGPEWMQDTNGEWVKTCDDVALLLPLMERATKPVWIKDVLYHYNNLRPDGWGTLDPENKQRTCDNLELTKKHAMLRERKNQ